MDDLQRLVARDAIKDLAIRYALAADGKDLDTLASLFARDVDNGRFGRGPDGVRRFYDQSLRKFHCSIHLVANHVIELDDRAEPTALSTATRNTTSSSLTIGMTRLWLTGTRMSRSTGPGSSDGGAFAPVSRPLGSS